MGCDGGTIPRRDELVRVKKKPEAKDKVAELAFQWLCCAITQQILNAPIVTCGLGRLYNKIALIEGLLNRGTLPEVAQHIKSLKDVKELTLAPNPEFKPDDDKKEGTTDDRACPYICPVTGLEMSGKFRFVALWTCGCVMSERALKSVNTQNCVVCQKPFTDDDIVILNAKDDDLVLMESRMEKRQASAKKKKEKKVKIKQESSDSSISVCSQEITITKNGKNTDSPSTSKCLDTASSSKSSDAISSSKNINTTSNASASKRPATNGTSEEDSKKKLKGNYSVAMDPKVSDVYKSIFTSHKSEQEQNRAHWVTYNPFYN